MSNFEYVIDGDKCYLVFGKNRMKIRWKKRWIPESEEPTVIPTEIELDEESITLDDFTTTVPLTATVTPEEYSGSLVWTSSNENIAIVSSSGVVAPVQFSTTPSVKTATITCASSLNPEVKATCAVTSTVVIPTAITLNEQDYTFTGVGKTLQLTPTFTPSGAIEDVVWSSSDSTKFSVDQTGLVTCLEDLVGEYVIITCTCKYNSAIKVTCNVNSMHE